MRDLVQRADRVLILDGCPMACATRLARGAFPNIDSHVEFADRLFDLSPDLFGVDEMPEVKINANTQRVAQEVARDFFGD